MAKLLVDYNEEGAVTVLSDSEKEITESIDTTVQESATQLAPEIEQADDVDMKPDDTLEDSEDDEEEEGDSENV